MPGIQIETYNFEPVQAALQSAPNELSAVVAESVTVEGAEVVRAMAAYPAERPGQKYVRTYKYARSINAQTVVAGPFVSWTLKALNPPNYWLRGDAYSYDGAWMHVGRWTSLRKIVETYVPQVVQRLTNRISTFLRFKFNG